MITAIKENDDGDIAVIDEHQCFTESLQSYTQHTIRLRESMDDLAR